MDLYYKCAQFWSETTNMMTISTIGAKFVYIGSFHQQTRMPKATFAKPKL